MTRPPADRTVQDADVHRDGKITRDVVLATALEIIDRDGADGLSMRRLTLRPRALARLGLALCAEVGHSWHRAAGTCDTAVFSGRRLTPTATSTRRPASEAVLIGMPQPPR
jgi:hypothetical protein